MKNWINARLAIGLTIDIYNEIRVLSETKKCHSPGPSVIRAKDNFGVYRALAYIFIDNDSGVFAESAMRSKHFPLIESELLGEIVVFEAYDLLKKVLNGNAAPAKAAEIEKRILYYRDELEFRGASIFGKAYDDSGDTVTA